MTLMKKLGAEPESGKLFLGIALLAAGSLANGSQAQLDVNGPVVAQVARANTDLVCTQEVKQCGDGRYVARDSARGCEFRPCEGGEQPLPRR